MSRAPKRAIDASAWISAALVRAALLRRQKEVLRRRAQLPDYTVWQRRLIQVARLCARRAERETIVSKARRDAKRVRRRIAARLRRAGQPPRPVRRSSGRPVTVEVQLLRAAVDVHRSRGVAYRDLARFLVQSIAAHFLPPQLGKRLTGAGSPAEQVLRLSQRLRKTAARYPPAR